MYIDGIWLEYQPNLLSDTIASISYSAIHLLICFFSLKTARAILGMLSNNFHFSNLPFFAYFILYEDRFNVFRSGNSFFKNNSASPSEAKITSLPFSLILLIIGIHRLSCPNPQLSWQINIFVKSVQLVMVV